jgi:hypothetical protein
VVHVGFGLGGCVARWENVGRRLLVLWVGRWSLASVVFRII